jgi:hypothetical protein
MTTETSDYNSRYIYPVLHIEKEYEEDMSKYRYKNSDKYYDYLMPFRLYCFQVCANIQGEGDLGSSNPIRFTDIVTNGSAKEKLLVELCKCFNSYIKTRYGYPGRDIRYTIDGTIYTNGGYGTNIEDDYKVEEKYNIKEMPYIMDFINETIDLVKSYYDIAS